jgi:hypothetical protein
MARRIESEQFRSAIPSNLSDDPSEVSTSTLSIQVL